MLDEFLKMTSGAFSFKVMSSSSHGLHVKKYWKHGHSGMLRLVDQRRRQPLCVSVSIQLKSTSYFMLVFPCVLECSRIAKIWFCISLSSIPLNMHVQSLASLYWVWPPPSNSGKWRFMWISCMRGISGISINAPYNLWTPGVDILRIT